MDERQFQEYKEGMRASDQGQGADRNPYPHDAENWWRNEAWQKGLEQAEYDRWSEDWDD